MKKRLAWLLLPIIVLSLVSACGKSASSDAGVVEEMTTYSYGNDAYYYDSAEVCYEAECEEEPNYETAASAQGTGETSVLDAADVKIIYTANIDMETTEFDKAVAGLEELVGEYGGYFESSNLSNYDTYRYGYYTVRIPAETFEQFCDTVGTLCQVNSVYKSAQNISESYYDTESRLATQQTKLARLQELLSEAENMEDIITIESAISDTEYEIENLTGTLRHYDSLVGYSTVSINLSEVFQLSDVEEPAIGFGSKLLSALRKGTVNFVEGLQDLLLSIARGWVGWLIFLVVVAAILRIMTKKIKKRKTKKQRLNAETKTQESDSDPANPT